MPRRVLAHDGLEVVEAALERVEPRRGALEPVGGADVEHQEAVDVAHERLVVEVAREQPGVRGCLAAVAADVEVPALVGGDDADVLAAGLGALAGAARDAELDLVRRPQPAVAVLEVDGHPDGVLHAVAAPRRADARLHGAQRLAVGLSRLHADVDEALPDRGQLLDAGAEEVDALAAGDLDVEAEVLGDLADRDELLGRDLATRHPRDDGVGAVLLDVGEEVVVAVLQRGLLAVEDVVAARRREDRGDGRLADLAAGARAVARDEPREGADAGRRRRSRRARPGSARSARTAPWTARRRSRRGAS